VKGATLSSRNEKDRFRGKSSRDDTLGCFRLSSRQKNEGAAEDTSAGDDGWGRRLETTAGDDGWGRRLGIAVERTSRSSEPAEGLQLVRRSSWVTMRTFEICRHLRTLCNHLYSFLIIFVNFT
jgi:hypothetical protein